MHLAYYSIRILDLYHLSGLLKNLGKLGIDIL